jgi:hypothetical protein
MRGTIDLNSIVAMMNRAASITQSEADAPIKKMNYGEPTQVNPIQNPQKGKKEMEEASAPIKQVSSNMLPVDPEQQVMLMQHLDSDEQNYIMQAFNVVNSRTA